ncbi:MAG: cation transporter [Gemmatimonas sp.]|nr:cation transporter [Gemmatimonas sp.]
MSCCNDKGCEVEALRASQSRVLWAVLSINGGMFVVELAIGMLAGSVALLADSLDMLGDTLVYGFSLFVIGRGDRWRARSALLKGGIMMAFGIGVLVQAGFRVVQPRVPEAGLMGSTALLALAANAVCLYLLTRHRGDDVNMRSTWLCSRNDIVANTGVIAAAGATALTRSGGPDLLISLAITTVLLRSALTVLFEAWSELRPALCPARLCPADACSCPAHA